MHKKIRFCKIIVALTLIHGFTLTTLSYILAFLGKDPVAEVSTVLITEVLAPVVTYLATNTIANIFEKNKLSFSTPLEHVYKMTNESKENYEDDSSNEDSLIEETTTTEEEIANE